jgi:hypothetical protein
MEFFGHDRSRLNPFKYGDNYPPRAIYMRALSLVDPAKVVATFVEKKSTERQTTLTLWTLLPSSLARIVGVGPKNWDTSQRADADAVTADLWPFSSIVRVSIPLVETRDHPEGGSRWTSQFELVTSETNVVLPSDISWQTVFVGGDLDAFASTLLEGLGN